MNEISALNQPMASGWFKSSYSAADNECVEVAVLGPGVGVRDSKDSDTGVLVVSARCFSAFINGLTAQAA
ncbi:DUF397 domain-containing protein [Streptomyces kunmingensis]|uniref:DUF397 domain-containing protein n=1 Tax=Streptomyces kunmingensis TaxID=68225 RepID=A0ABU6CPF7_9ACTN|nr:DUF397 domain-containing protein [Streptomyces kunmingensis]MEB3966625.1 DUF397 domain-containing protein [Streptomyces kunmingensis]